MQNAFYWINDMPKGITSNSKLSIKDKLYRYINLSQFLSWMETKQTYLTRVESWDDPKEIPIKENYLDDPEKLDICSSIYGQCWSRNHDSDALWHIYSQNHEGLMIETSVAKFDIIEGLRFGLLSRVIYGEYDDDAGNPFFQEFPHPMHRFLIGCTTALHKREAFEHEKEVRLLTVNPFGFENPLPLFVDASTTDKLKCVPVSLDPKEFIMGITIDPRASDWYVKTIQKYCERYELPVIPVKSKLYEPWNKQ